MKTHPFERTPWNRYGFEIGQELEWFEWMVNYRDALKDYRNSLKIGRYKCDVQLNQYIAVKEELTHIRALIYSYVTANIFRPFHLDFLKSKKLDATEKIKLKNNLLKAYENSEYKDGNYYLSIVNIKL